MDMQICKRVDGGTKIAQLSDYSNLHLYALWRGLITTLADWQLCHCFQLLPVMYMLLNSFNS